eukprot:g411.t1
MASFIPKNPNQTMSVSNETTQGNTTHYDIDVNVSVDLENLQQDDKARMDETDQLLSQEDYNYPQHPLTEELACIPNMPGNLVRVGKLYVCCVKNSEGKLVTNNNRGNMTLRPKDLKWTVGPCWPMLLCTYSLIIGISSTVYISYLPTLPWIFSVGGLLLLGIVVIALTKTACGNPGILPRVTTVPEGEERWRWNDSAQSYVPPGATYCQESQVIVYDYDHFCPWTGTTIAGGNMSAFSCFVSSLGILCVFVMFLAVAGSAAAIQLQHAK